MLLAALYLCEREKGDVSIELLSKQTAGSGGERKKSARLSCQHTPKSIHLIRGQQTESTAVVIHTSSETSKHVKMCKLTNTRLHPEWGSSSTRRMYECAYARARACWTTAEGIAAQQELMRRVTDGAACLCQHSMEDSLAESGVSEEAEERGREPVLMGNVKRCSGVRVWLAPRLHRTSALTPVSHTLTPRITKSTSRRLHPASCQAHVPEKLQINQGWTKSPLWQPRKKLQNNQPLDSFTYFYDVFRGRTCGFQVNYLMRQKLLFVSPEKKGGALSCIRNRHTAR